MEKNKFITDFRNAFGNYELPIAIWYSDVAAASPQKTRGCFIKDLKPAREGGTVSLSLDTVSCPGAKTYCGFAEAPAFLPSFVSEKEHYKKTPDMIANFVKELKIADKSELYLNFSSIDNIQNFDHVEGLIFFATPDVLTGLVSWSLYDTNQDDAVSAPFGAGCTSIVTQTVRENRNNGKRNFIGLFDPSVRPHVEANILSFSVPMSRFKEMYHTINDSCLVGTHAWKKVKERIDNTQVEKA